MNPRAEKMRLERMERELGYTPNYSVPTTVYNRPADAPDPGPAVPVEHACDGVILETEDGYKVIDFDEPMAYYTYLRNYLDYAPRNAFQSVLARFCTDRDAYWQRVAKAGRADRFTWQEGDLTRIDEKDIAPIEEAE